MNPTADILLETLNLSVGYKDGKSRVEVLSDVNISLAKGELVCLMGQNGVGKSTLLRTISGVQKPLDGQVLIKENDVHNISQKERAKLISLILTDRLNAGNLSVYEVISMGRYPFMSWDMRLGEQDQVAIKTAIDQVGIRDLIEQKIYKLSDGQLQKVMIARALAQNGNIIILDEPTAHLDLNNRVAVIRLLRKLAKEHQKVIIMATHELDLALQTADRLIVVNASKEVLSGIPEGLVLNGTLDKVFDLKGYDLKTGQFIHNSNRSNIKLTGEGYSYLWTKNALERLGYRIADQTEIGVSVHQELGSIVWRMNDNSSEMHFSSIEDLLQALNEKSATE